MMKSSIIRKASAAALSLTLGASLLAGCTGKNGNGENAATPRLLTASLRQPAAETKADPFGKQPELTVITRGTWTDPNTKYPDGQSLEDNAYTRMLKEKYNIEIKNEFVASDYQKQVDLAIASGKIPDYLTNLTYTEYRAIVKAGLAMDISKVWEQYASPDRRRQYTTPTRNCSTAWSSKTARCMAFLPPNRFRISWLSCGFVKIGWINWDSRRLRTWTSLKPWRKRS